MSLSSLVKLRALFFLKFQSDVFLTSTRSITSQPIEECALNLNLVYNYRCDPWVRHSYAWASFDERDDMNFPPNSQPTTMLHWRPEASGNVPYITIHATFEALRNLSSLMHDDAIIENSDDEPIIMEDDLCWRLREIEYTIGQTYPIGNISMIRSRSSQAWKNFELEDKRIIQGLLQCVGLSSARLYW